MVLNGSSNSGNGSGGDSDYSNGRSQSNHFCVYKSHTDLQSKNGGSRSLMRLSLRICLNSEWFHVRQRRLQIYNKWYKNRYINIYHIHRPHAYIYIYLDYICLTLFSWIWWKCRGFFWIVQMVNIQLWYNICRQYLNFSPGKHNHSKYLFSSWVRKKMLWDHAARCIKPWMANRSFQFFKINIVIT